MKETVNVWKAFLEAGVLADERGMVRLLTKGTLCGWWSRVHSDAGVPGWGPFL